jgi:thiamine biosynthesis protein ThiS
MQITVNGENRALVGALTIKELLRDLGIDPRKVAVERNLEIVPKSTFGSVLVDDGDRLEIVHFIGGG